MKQRLQAVLSSKLSLIILFSLFAIVASLQALLSGTKTYVEGGLVYNKYNNYTIFEKSFEHLLDDQDLYILYPEEHWDLYKYTPTFSLLFGVFAVCPDWLGLNLWNLLNALVLLFAIYYLPRLSALQKGYVSLIVLLELMTSLQNAQSNGLMAGLLVLTFAFLERKQYFWAPLFVVFSVFIKLFGIVGFAVFLFYPQKWKLALYTLFWTAVLFLLPLLVVDFQQYMFLFESYGRMLSTDHSISYGFSVMGWLVSWFSFEPNKYLVVLIGVILFLLPLVRWSNYKHFFFRYLTLASVLIWVVIFNHKAESPTFVIAMTGVALWFIASEKSPLNIALFIAAFVLTSLSPTDLFPRYLRNEIVVPYNLKAVPCILIWLKLIYDMITYKEERYPQDGTLVRGQELGG